MNPAEIECPECRHDARDHGRRGCWVSGCECNYDWDANSETEQHAPVWRELRYHLQAEHGLRTLPLESHDLLWLETEHLDRHKTRVKVTQA